MTPGGKELILMSPFCFYSRFSMEEQHELFSDDKVAIFYLNRRHTQ